MGIIFSRWRKRESSKDILEALEQDIEYVKTRQHILEQLRQKYIGLFLLYSVIIYILAALVFYFKYFPTTWKERVIRTSPLLVFPLVVYGVKRLLHFLFVSRMAKHARRLDELQEKKKQVLEEVMEKETYKTAKELLEKYDPNSEIFKDERRDLQSPTDQSQPQSPAGTELRRRNVPGGTESPGPLQRTSSLPTLSEGPAQGGNPATGSIPGSTPVNSPMKSPAPANQQGPQGMQGHRPLPGPPKPAFPIPARERSNMDKVVEYLIGDGPSNRYALVCQRCWSHNGMALKEEFEYIAFRCCYCFHPNPARKQRPTAPKLEDDPMTPGRKRKNPPPSPKVNKGSTGSNDQVKPEGRRPPNGVQDMPGLVQDAADNEQVKPNGVSNGHDSINSDVEENTVTGKA